MFHSLKPREKYFLTTVTSLLLLAITLPYIWAWLLTPKGFHFSGILFNPADQNVHWAWAHQASNGHFTLRDIFTSESLTAEARPLFVNLYASLIGVTSRLTHVRIVWVSHLYRAIFTVLAMIWFYDLCSQIIKSISTRYLALLFAAFSTGVGWLYPVFPNLIFMDRPDMTTFPMMPEAYIFTSAYIFGLNIAALALIVLVYGQLLRAEEKQSWKHVCIAAVAAFLLANIHTYDAIPMLGILGIWLFWRLTQGKSTFSSVAPFTIIISILLPVIYQYVVFKSDELFRLKAITYTQAPHLPDVLFSYGLVFVFAIVGVAYLWRWRHHNRRLLLLVTWVFVTIFAIYVPALLGHPFSFERKMIEGMHWPLCILAALGLAAIIKQLKNTLLRNILVTSILIINCVSTVQFVAWSVLTASDHNRENNNPLMPPLYLSQEDQAALNYFQAHPDHTKAVLCLSNIGNYIPPQTGMVVYLGHWAETIDYKNKLTQTIHFFKGEISPADAKRWLQQNHIGYVLIGSQERQLGATLPFPMKSVFTAGQTTIYAVK